MTLAVAGTSSGAAGTRFKSVFVTVPCYNYGCYLEDCVRSVLDQHGVEPRVLIIDDASPDDTAIVAERLVRSDPRVQFIRHAGNAGHLATFNEGIAAATGDYFLLLSADDYLLPGALARAVDLMERHPEVGFTFGPARVEGEAGAAAPPPPHRRLRGTDQVLSGREFIRLSGARNIVLTPTVVIRRALQQRVGGYLPTLPHSGDMEMWLRLAAEGSVGYIAVDQAIYRRHQSNMSLGYDGMADLHARELALRAFIAAGALKLDPSRRLERECLRWLAGEAFRLAGMALNTGDAKAAARFKAYGLSLSPRARLTLNWLKLQVKQVAPWWRLLRPGA